VNAYDAISLDFLDEASTAEFPEFQEYARLLVAGQLAKHSQGMHVGHSYLTGMPRVKAARLRFAEFNCNNSLRNPSYWCNVFDEDEPA
jgi:hypothetical protein